MTNETVNTEIQAVNAEVMQLTRDALKTAARAVVRAFNGDLPKEVNIILAEQISRLELIKIKVDEGIKPNFYELRYLITMTEYAKDAGFTDKPVAEANDAISINESEEEA